jgi:ASC-1-like (ASCH) protein
MDVKETKRNIIQAGQRAVEELIKVAKESIINSEDDLTADKLKNAAATKKLAIFDAFEILSRIEQEEEMLDDKPKDDTKKKSEFKGFAEGRAKFN